MSRTTDAIIIGAGVMGSSIALEFARLGLSVCVVDKGSAPGHGSTSASSAIVRYNYSTWDGVALAWESKFRWENWEEHLGFRDPNGMAKFVRTGLVFLDVDAVPRQRMMGLFKRAEIPFEDWNSETLASILPGIDRGRYFPPKPIYEDAFFDEAHGAVGAVFTPDAGYIDDPQLAAANLARAAQGQGAHFMFKRQVSEIHRAEDSWRIYLSGSDTLEAAIVVNAAGPWSTRINNIAGVGADFRISVAPMRQEVHHVRLPSDLAGASLPILTDLDLGTYIRPDGDHSLLIGGTEPECDPLEWIEDPDAIDIRPTVPRFEAQVTRGARRIPSITVPNVPSGIAGVYDVAQDWTPIYDKTDRPGFFVAMGTSGNQFKNAPVVGDLVKSIVSADIQGIDHDRTPVRFTAPHTGHEINLRAFSRLRSVNGESSGTVIG